MYQKETIYIEIILQGFANYPFVALLPVVLKVLSIHKASEGIKYTAGVLPTSKCNPSYCVT